MSTIPFLLIPFLEYLVPTGVVVWLALLIFKKRMTQDIWVSWLAPICLLAALMFATERGTLANFFFEPLMLAVIVMLLLVIRIVLGGRAAAEEKNGEKLLAGLTTCLLLLAAVCIVFLTPAIAE